MQTLRNKIKDKAGFNFLTRPVILTCDSFLEGAKVFVLEISHTESRERLSLLHHQRLLAAH